MGAGSSAAGFYPAGFDPATFTDRSRVEQRDPVMFSLGIRGTPRDAQGLLKTVHWVDQAVALALGIGAGDLSSVPTLGNTLRKIKRAAGPQLESQVKDAVRGALQALLDRKDIAVVDLVVTTPVRGRIITDVTYVNLRLPVVTGAKPLSPTVRLVF